MNFSAIDKAPADVLNRVLWHAMRGPATAFAEWAVTGYDENKDDKNDDDDFVEAGDN
jgi:hypothetical protein